MTGQQRMLNSAADLAREYGTYWVGAEELVAAVVRRRQRGECTDTRPRPRLLRARTTDSYRGNRCRETPPMPEWSRMRRLLSGGAAHGPPTVAARFNSPGDTPVLIKLVTAVAISAAMLTFAPIAAAGTPDPNGPEGVVAGLLQGFAGAFGSSSPNRQVHPQSYIYPDFQSCNREANRLRQPGVTAECNPVGGASGQYQLIYIPRR